MAAKTPIIALVDPAVRAQLERRAKQGDRTLSAEIRRALAGSIRAVEMAGWDTSTSAGGTLTRKSFGGTAPRVARASACTDAFVDRLVRL